MYNIVFYRELAAAGVSTRTIRQAQNCCLLKLCDGVYTIFLNCGRHAHRRIAELIEDTNWTDRHAETSRRELLDDYDYLDLLRVLRIRNYQHYRKDDTVWATSAAMLHGIPLLRRDSGPISVTHPTSSSRSREITRSAREMPEADRCRTELLGVTTAKRTALDLIPVLGQQAGFAAMEHVLRATMFARPDAPDPRRGYPPEFIRLARQELVDNWFPAIARLRTGQSSARLMAEVASPLSESIGESYCSFNLHSLKLVGFEQQVRIFDEFGFISRNDFRNRQNMTILEVDGYSKYVKAGPERMKTESDQHNRLLALGYRIVRFRFKELLNLTVFSTKLFAQAPDLRNCIARPAAGG